MAGEHVSEVIAGILATTVRVMDQRAFRPAGIKGHSQGVHDDPTPDRQDATYPFAALTDRGRDIFRSPDWIGVFCADVGTFSARQMTTGKSFYQLIGLING